MDGVSKYETQFDPQAYIKSFMSELDYPNKTESEDFLYRAFSTGKISGKTLLDVGSGPTLKAAFSASKHVEEVYLSDLVTENRKALEKWLRKDPDAFDFTWQFKHVAGIEGNGDYKSVEERVRSAIKGIIPCNVLLSNPITPVVRQYDIVTTFECLDCITNEEDFIQSMKNVAGLVRVGGFFVILGTIGCTYYWVGDTHFKVAKLDPTIVKSAMKQADLKVQDFQVRYYDNDLKIPSDDKGFFMAIATKI